MSKFADQILRFNTMYNLNGGIGFAALSASDFGERLNQFEEILSKEMDEAEELRTLLEGVEIDEDIPLNDPKSSEIVKRIRKYYPNATMEQILAVANADWLGDIIVYCASELRRYGLDMDVVLDSIMESNFTKLDEYGKPIINSLGKVDKGPRYEPPEKMLYERIFSTFVKGD